MRCGRWSLLRRWDKGRPRPRPRTIFWQTFLSDGTWPSIVISDGHVRSIRQSLRPSPSFAPPVNTLQVDSHQPQHTQHDPAQAIERPAEGDGTSTDDRRGGTTSTGAAAVSQPRFGRLAQQPEKLEDRDGQHAQVGAEAARIVNGR